MEIIVGLVVLIYSMILHEIAHGFVADRLGDPTARIMGRLTLNPRSHIDPMMSIFLPLFLIISGSPIIFGGVKPSPTDPFNFREGRKDVALAALAGPLTNALLAMAAAAIYNIPIPLPSEIRLLLFLIVQYNLILTILNLIPLPPFDGSKIFSILLSEEQAARYLSIGPMGVFILIFLLVFPIGPFHLGDVVFSLVHAGLTALGF